MIANTHNLEQKSQERKHSQDIFLYKLNLAKSILFFFLILLGTIFSITANWGQIEQAIHESENLKPYKISYSESTNLFNSILVAPQSIYSSNGSQHRAKSPQKESLQLSSLSFQSHLGQKPAEGDGSVEAQPNSDGPASSQIDKNTRKTTNSNFKLEKHHTIVHIPSVNIKGNIVEGKNETSLNRGFWFYPTSSSPGEKGNTVIIGHRFLKIPPAQDTFFNLDKVKIGDKIKVSNDLFNLWYTVVDIKIVNPQNTSVLLQTNDYRITLITCTPLWSDKKRLIIVGMLDDVENWK